MVKHISITKAECQRIDAFELWCWRKLLRVPWTARRSNQSILKENNPEYLLGGLMLKLQYFAHMVRRADLLERRADSLEKTLMLGLRARGKGVDSGWDGWMASLSQWKEFKQTPGNGERQGNLACCSPRGVTKSQKWLSDEQQLVFQLFIHQTWSQVPLQFQGWIRLSFCPGEVKAHQGGKYTSHYWREW